MKDVFVESAEKRGFTLIELLVTISIIVILAAVLFPVFARARENARRASCQSNMKQLAMGALMYTQDYDGRLYPGTPPGSGRSVWIEAYDSYLTDNTSLLFYCPSSNNKFKGRRATGSTASTNYDIYYSDYGFSTIWTPHVTIRGVTARSGSSYPLDSLPQLSKTCLLGEVASGDESLMRGQTVFGAESYHGNLRKSRHFDGSNYAYADGHVKWLKQEAVDAVIEAQTENGRSRNGVTEAEAANLPIVFSWTVG